MLYWTGDGPRADEIGARTFGWWVDGSYPFTGYDDEKLGIMARALKAGNPRSIVAFNRGVDPLVMSYTPVDDYTTGEQNRFFDTPASTGRPFRQEISPTGSSPSC